MIHESQKEKDAHYKITVILPKNHVSNDLYTFQVQKEITKMAGHVMDMMDYLNQGLNQNNVTLESLAEAMNFQEEYVDEMNHEISWFLQKCSRLPTAPQSGVT